MALMSQANEEGESMVMPELIEFGARQRKSSSDLTNSSEMECSSPASTSYGGHSPSQRRSVGSSLLSEHRADREKQLKVGKQVQSRRRLNGSPGNRKTFEKTVTPKTVAPDCGLSWTGKFEGKSSNLNLGRKKLTGRKLLASKVCLAQDVDALPVESEASGEEDLENSKTFERLVQLSELEEEVLLLHKRLAEELELREVLEKALKHASGSLTNFSRYLPVSAQELLANITLLEVEVLKLEEESSILQSEVGQARTEREIAELKHSSAERPQLRVEGSDLQSFSSLSNGDLKDDHTVRLPGSAPDFEIQNFPAATVPTSIKTTTPESCLSLDIPVLGEELDSQNPQKSWEEQQAFTLRQDLRLTIPEAFENYHANVTPWCLNHEYDPIRGRQSQRLKSFWKNNPLEEETHWVPLNEHHPQTMISGNDYDSSQDRNGDLYPPSVGCVAYDKNDPSCFSPAIITKTVRTHYPDMADLAEDDDKSILPIAEVLWKPSPRKPSAFEDSGKKNPKMVLLTTKPESWSFRSEDDHPRPESGSVSHSMVFEDQPCSQANESLSIDEQRTKYRIGVLKVREQRRQGILEKNFENVKALDSPRTPSISSAKLGGYLSPSHRLPLDTRAQSENEYGLEESVEMKNIYDHATSIKSPNELSEEMVQCMINIYGHLADSINTSKDSLLLESTGSPTSPFTVMTNSSTSFFESSLLSVGRSPLVDLRSKDVMGNDASSDPFKSRGKLPWADIGPYANVLEVLWLSVDKDQLEFAAQALRSFKIMVEQLSRVDPSSLKHEEKLAFWINLYNAILMHAYLAFGIPRSDLKFVSLLQKAAYTVGGYSFNAATIEFCLLRSKSTAHRSQLNLLTSLHKNKLAEDQSKFGIDHPEALVSFGLCNGTRSSPMVRVYTPKHVKSQLEDALCDYARAAVGISTKGKLLVPKLLYSYAREFVEDVDLLNWVCNLLPSNQVAVVIECTQQPRHRILGSRNFNTLPNDVTFRYLLPAETRSKTIF